MTHTAGRPSSRLLSSAIWLMAAALVVRALLGLADTIALAEGGVRTLPAGGVGLGASSPVWSGLLALLACAGAVGLVARWSVGWLIAMGACVGYLLSGLGDLAFIASAAGVGALDVAVLIVADVGIPVVVIAGLLWTRMEFLSTSRAGGSPRARGVPGQHVPAVVEAADEPPAGPPATA